MTHHRDGPAGTRDQGTASTGQDTAWLGAYAISLAFTEASQAACATRLGQAAGGNTQVLHRARSRVADLTGLHPALRRRAVGLLQAATTSRQPAPPA